MNLVTPKAGAKHELLLIEPASGLRLSNKSLCLAAALRVTKYTKVRDDYGHTLLSYSSQF